jgi:RHS repeat-associated protein
VTAVLLDVQNPDTLPVGDQSIFYDGSGNRTVFRPYESQDAYTVNDLNQYTGRTTAADNPLRPTPTPRPPPTPPPHPTPTPLPDPSPTPTPTPPGQQTAAYDYAGNMTTGFDVSAYSYDAQNRLLNVIKGGVTMTFAYDGLNRQVSRILAGIGQGPDWGTTFSVWDGWDLIEEYRSGNNVTAAYLYGPDGLVKNLTANEFYYHDGSGSTSHLADSAGNLLEWYRYDLQGTPVFYDANNNQLPASNYAVRHLFTGQQWYGDVGLYDLRNRFYSPDIGRFLQPDPVGFRGDPTNLYRYSGNNPVTRFDPTGTSMQNLKADQGGGKGDFLDYGYWGGDGTAGVYFGLMGYDWSGNELGMLQTEQYYSMYNVSYSYAMGVNGYGSIGGIVFPQPILKATDAHTGLYGNGSAPGTANLGSIGNGIGDLIGKIWNLPNDVIGLALGLLTLPFDLANGGGIQLGSNAIQFTGFPIGPTDGGALTLGNVQLFHGSDFIPSTNFTSPYTGLEVNAGLHEEAHTWQSQILGPFFLPVYFLNGGVSGSNPFERAADYYSNGGSYWPGGG